MKCPKCNSIIPNDSVFCENCGAKVVDDYLKDNMGNRNPNKKRNLFYLVFCVVILVFLITIFAIIQGNRNVENSGKLSVETMYDQGFVDLGLPSGTLWKNRNEEGIFTYDEAFKLFGNELPTEDQWQELLSKCDWEWTGGGFTVTGPNGLSISIPSINSCDCDGNVWENEGRVSYWSSTSRELLNEAGEKQICKFVFDFDSVNEYRLSYFSPCYSFPVRVVHEKTNIN